MKPIRRTFRGRRNYINDCVIEAIDNLQRKGIEVETYTVTYLKEGDILEGHLYIQTNERKD